MGQISAASGQNRARFRPDCGWNPAAFYSPVSRPNRGRNPAGADGAEVAGTMEKRWPLHARTGCAGMGVQEINTNVLYIYILFMYKTFIEVLAWSVTRRSQGDTNSRGTTATINMKEGSHWHYSGGVTEAAVSILC